jgi:galactokinase
MMPASRPATSATGEGLVALQQRACAALQRAFGRSAQGATQAPGRVNLIGEHTDYNDGFVLPCAIDRHAVIAWASRDDAQVRVVAADVALETDAFVLDAERIADRNVVRAVDRNANVPARPWARYVRGIALELLRAGLPLRGVDLAIAGDVPAGAGLSSSAALELAAGRAFLEAAGAQLEGTALALAAQRAENDFVGCRCGVMDQLVSAHGAAAHALLIDCRSLVWRSVPLPPGTALLVAHSRVHRGLVDSAYNARRQSCEEAAAALGVKALRDADLRALQRLHAAGRLDDTSWRRARHVVTENARTLAAADALAAGDLRRLGTLMEASHASMRDDFEITVPAVDALAALMHAAITEGGREGGARMTGGGFGGCVIGVMPQSRVAAVRTAVLEGYRSPQGEAAWLLECRAVDGASVLSPALSPA